MESKEPSRTSVSIFFQFSLIILNISILMGLIIWQSYSFISHETPPTIHPVTTEKYQEFGGFSHIITVGLLIDQFIDFNLVTNSFTFDGTIWFRFDPGAISLDTLSKFSFLKGTIVKKIDPDIRLIDNKMLVKYGIRIHFESDINYQDFPLDGHRVYLMLINKFVSPSEVLFESSRGEFTINAKVSSAGWNLIDTSVINGYIQSTLDPYDTRHDVQYPATLFTLDYSRNSIRYALSIILPLALILYLLLFSISLHLRSAIAMSSAGVTGILAYRFVIENLSPKTGFFMISDYLFFLLLAATISVFIINVSEVGKNFSSTFKKICIALLHIIIITTAIYIIVW